MAVITATVTQIEADALLVQWANMANGDTGSPIELTSYSDRSVQIQGTFGVGGTCVVQGSNDSTDYQTLTDPQGNAVSKTAAAIETLTELTRLTRPSITAGDGTTALTVSMLLRKTSR